MHLQSSAVDVCEAMICLMYCSEENTLTTPPLLDQLDCVIGQHTGHFKPTLCGTAAVRSFRHMLICRCSM